MATDDGLIAKLEASFVAVLAALQVDSVDVFKTADHWRHQVGAVGGGLEAFPRYAPFAFVGYQDDESAREGGYDLREVPTINILIGVCSEHAGVARIGDDNHLGTSKIRDLVIAAFESKTPAGDLGCDESYYIGGVTVVDAPKRHAIEMVFEISKMTPNRE